MNDYGYDHAHDYARYDDVYVTLNKMTGKNQAIKKNLIYNSYFSNEKQTLRRR